MTINELLNTNVELIDNRQANHKRIDGIDDNETLKAECKLWYDLYITAQRIEGNLIEQNAELNATVNSYKLAFKKLKRFVKDIMASGWGIKPVMKKINEVEPKGVRNGRR